MVGIVSYGTYIPRYRLKIEEIARTWGKDAQEVVGSLGLKEKSVAGIDEDAVTLAMEAAGRALNSSIVRAEQIGALFVGSESHPYAVNPTSTIVGELLGVGNNYLAADLEFACKAGTAGMQAITGLIASGQIKYGLAIGADTAQSRPHDALEYASAAAGVAYLMGNGNPTSSSYPPSLKLRGTQRGASKGISGEIVAELLTYTSYSSDTPDFWRRDGIRYPSHAGRFTGEPAYFVHVMGAAKQLMQKGGVKVEDVDYCIFHMPNGKFPRDVARRLGFTATQLAPSLTVDAIGNPYSASAMLGLAAVLDMAKPGVKIFMVSYGSGAGSDGFLFKTTPNIVKKHEARIKNQETVNRQIERKTYIDYVEYLKKTHKI